MVSRVKILPENVAEKIAAGEVVERPASVVKELVENSIDAYAKKIFVFVKQGGFEEIRVVDDGIGMSDEEAKLAFHRHATSKIKSDEDLENITTLGFRGEALPSIAAISMVEMLTRPKDALIGTRVLIKGNKIKKIESAGCPSGTSISVRNIFFNTPARRKFLKDAHHEFGYIFGVMEKYALSRTGIHIKLVHNGRKLIDAPPADLQDRVAKLWGGDVAKNMVKIEHNGDVKLNGYVSKPFLTRKDKNRIIVFVNGRYVKNYELTQAIISGYGTLLFRDSYPYAVLMIDIPPEQVDVNVHPAKLLVKFRNKERIKKLIEKTIWNTLTSGDNIPRERIETNEEHILVSGKIKKEKQAVFEIEEGKKEKSLFDYISRARLPGYEIFGQFDDTYIIAKSTDAILIVDQHAAHERIRYERLLREIKEKKIQKLIDPFVINLGMSDYHVLLSISSHLREFGLIVDDFGDGTVVVRAIPPILKRSYIIEVIRGIIDIGPKYIERKKDDIIKLISCKGAIKAHEKLSVFEMEELLGQLLKCENPYTCPHGRPTIIQFRQEDLEKMFKRKE